MFFKVLGLLAALKMIDGNENIKPKKGVVIHHAATPNNDNLKVTVEMIDKWHKKRGFRKIGYHFFIPRIGAFQVGREENEEGAHALGYNHYFGVCFDGTGPGKIINKKMSGGSTNFLTSSQKKEYKKLMNYLNSKYNIFDIKGHYQTYKNKNIEKSCPGFKVVQSMKNGEL